MKFHCRVSRANHAGPDTEVTRNPTMSRSTPMSRHMQENLRILVGRFGSVAAFCRETGINRQQFNKYLAGLHRPSAKNIAKLSGHFSLSPGDFFLDRTSFEAALAPDNAPEPVGARSTHLQRLSELALACANDLKPFLGTYFRYHYSSIYPGSIVRAVTVIYRGHAGVEHLTIERFPLPAQEGTGQYTFLYSGVCYLLGNRIFLVDYERRQHNEMTMAVLMPQNRTPIKYLYGFLTGVAATAFRQPFSGRVVFERRSDDARIRRATLRLATVIDPGHPEIPPSVSRFFAGGDAPLIAGHE